MTTRTWRELTFPPDRKFLSDNLASLLLIAFALYYPSTCATFCFSGKPPTTRPRLAMRPGLGRGRGVRFSPAATPSTPVVAVHGTLQATNLRVVVSSDNSQLSERRAEKLPLEEPSSPTDKAEAPANDALVRKKSSSWSLRATYADKDPREIMRVLRQGIHNYIDTFDELPDGMET